MNLQKMNRQELMNRLILMHELMEESYGRDTNMYRAYSEQVEFIIARLEKLND